ncbi:unnamed protein product, partial [Hapterophycus canaliculatus]
GSEGQPQQQQQQQRAPLRQGSSLRPGGRAAVVGSTPTARTASGVGRLEPRTSGTGDDVGSLRGTERYNNGDQAPQLSPARGTAERNGILNSARTDGPIPVRGAELRVRGGGNASPDASPGPSRARENMDRMMSSLLEEVLPDTREGVASGAVVASTGGGSEEGRSQFSPSVAVSTRSAGADSPDTTARRSSPNDPCSPVSSTPPPARRYPNHPTSPGEAPSGSMDSGGVFLTPIEVIMHAPAGGCGSTERRAGSCRQCAASAETTSNGDTRHAFQKQQEVAPDSVSGSARIPVMVSGRARKASGRATNERVPASTRQASDNAIGTSDGSGTSSDRKDASSTNGGGRAARARHELPKRGAQRAGVSDGDVAEREDEKPSKREAGAARTTGGGTYDSEELGVSKAGEEAALLRRNHATLLRVIREQEIREKQIERRFEDKERDWLERVTTLEADMEGLRAEKVEARGRLRRAEVSSPSSEVFERYEAHAGLLEAENTSLRDQNIALEMRLLDVLQRSTAAARLGSTGTAPTKPADPDVERQGPQKGRHRQPAKSASAGASCEEEEKEKEEQREGYDVAPHQRPFETGLFRPETDAHRLPSGYARRDGAVTTRFRVDGRVAPNACGVRVAGSQPGGGAPMCAAVLKDLRRRLKEVEVEANQMRAERAAVE